MILIEKQKCIQKSLIAILLTVALLSGCKSSQVECRIKITDTESNRAAANKTVVFFHDTERLDNPIVRVEVNLDANGEAHIRLPKVSWMARFDEHGVPYGASVDLHDGGEFRLYGPPPVPTDTNLYPSKYVIEIRKP